MTHRHKLSSEEFLKIVVKSGIVEPKVLDRLMAKVRQKLGGTLPPNPKKLAFLMEKKGLLTAWQNEKLLAGKYKGFFLGKYKLLGHIGSGGMSSVYLAEHTRMGDQRAIKVLPKSRVSDATYLRRFQQEAKAIASLSHRNIVRAYDIDNEGDVHYIVMEHVDGLDLQQLVKRDGATDFSTAADLIAQAARGLEHAHSKGVIHRDVKPANLLVNPDGVVKLLDMGLALVNAGEEESLTVANNENVLGTADYLAPEQALNSHMVDHRADIYGLGCTFYFLLTGQPPFNDGTLAQRIAKHQTEMPSAIGDHRKNCPGQLDGICVKMIQKDPKYRYQSAGDVAEVLEKFAAEVPRGAAIVVESGQSQMFEEANSSILIANLNLPEDSADDEPTNENEETLAESREMALRSGGIGSGDSGRLVDVKRRPNLIDGSFLDLQLESGYRANSQVGRVSSSSIGTAVRSVKSRDGKSGVSLDQHASQNSDVYQRSPSSLPGNINTERRSGRKEKSGMDPLLVGALLTALFVVALAIGFFLARATS